MARPGDPVGDPKEEFEGDVAYAVWRSGGNPDRLHPDRVANAYYDGWEAEAFARAELRRQRQAAHHVTDESPQGSEEA